MTGPLYWDDAKAALSKRDKTLKKIIGSYQGETMTLRADPFFTLARSITGQQISVKAADSVWKKVTGTVGRMTPKAVAEISEKELRACGLSASKVLYMQSLARHFLENRKTIKNWPNMSDDEIIAELTDIKGIGRWTAEMFLIFHLGRPDVFPVADIGLQKAVFRHYHKELNLRSAASPRGAAQAARRNGASPRQDQKPGSSTIISRETLLELGENWRPWRTVATWYLWRALDPVPVAY